MFNHAAGPDPLRRSECETSIVPQAELVKKSLVSRKSAIWPNRLHPKLPVKTVETLRETLSSRNPTDGGLRALCVCRA
jgi:hypothetical protein